MVPEPVLAGITEAVLTYALEQVGAVDWLRNKAANRAFQSALASAYQTWAPGHAKWTASLFDASFLQHEGAPVLAQLLLRNGRPDPSELAVRWADSLKMTQPEQRTTYTRELEPVAADFLNQLAHELKQEPEFQALNDSRALDQLVEISQALRVKLDAGEASPGTRWDYLRWITESNLYLDPRGVAQTQRQVQVKLDEIYISLQAQREEILSSADRRLLDEELLELQQKLDSRTPAEKREDLEELTYASYEMRHLRGSPRSAAEVLELAEVVRRHDRLVILGDPGSGKSTLLRYLALSHGQALRRGATEAGDGLGPAKFPILIRIANYAEDGRWKNNALSDYLDNYHRLHECSTMGLASLLASELAGGNCLVLLDGLDEIVNADERRGIVQRIEEFIRHCGSHANRYVVTSRIAGYRSAQLSGPFPHYTVRDMDLPQISKFLERWCNAVEAAQTPDLAIERREAKAQAEIDGILKAVQLPGVRRLAGNPLLLRVLALIHHTGAQLPQKRIALYKLAADTLARNWRIAGGVPESALAKEEHLTRLLGVLAYWLHSEKATGIATEDEVYAVLGKEWAHILNVSWDEDNQNPTIVEEVRKFLLQVREHTGLFVERAPKRYGFMHLTFEEYYAARHLVARSRTAPQLIRDHLHDPRWEEPILLALGFKGLDYPVEAAELLAASILARGEDAEERYFTPSPYEDDLGRDYLFALRCLGDLIPAGPLTGELIDRLVQELLQQQGSAQYTQYRLALNERLDFLGGSDAGRGLVIRLNKALTDIESQVRVAAAESLGHLGQTAPEVLTALLTALTDRESRVRMAAAQSLGQLGQAGPAVITALLTTLTDSEGPVRVAAAESLGQLGQPSLEVGAALLAALSDPAIGVRLTVAQSIDQFKQIRREVVAALLAALAEPESKTRIAAAECLSWVVPTDLMVISAWLTALADSEIQVRLLAAQNMRWIEQASPEVFAALRTALVDPESRVRVVAAESLGHLGQAGPAVITALLTTLTDSEGPVRMAAAKSLGHLGQAGPAIITALLTALTDSESPVRMAAAKSLGHLGQAGPTIITALLTALTDSESRVRMAAAKSLGQLGQTASEVITALRAALTDPESRVRMAVVQSLDQLGCVGQEILAALLEILQRGPDWGVRMEVPPLLASHYVGESETVDALIEGLFDNDDDVPVACVFELGRIGQLFPSKTAEIADKLLQAMKRSDLDKPDRATNRSGRDYAYDALSQLITGMTNLR